MNKKPRLYGHGECRSFCQWIFITPFAQGKTWTYIFSSARQHISDESRQLDQGKKRYQWFSPVTGSKTPWLPYEGGMYLLQPMKHDTVLIIDILPETCNA